MLKKRVLLQLYPQGRNTILLLEGNSSLILNSFSKREVGEEEMVELFFQDEEKKNDFTIIEVMFEYNIY